jgi:hypothetical protein
MTVDDREDSTLAGDAPRSRYTDDELADALLASIGRAATPPVAEPAGSGVDELPEPPEQSDAGEQGAAEHKTDPAQSEDVAGGAAGPTPDDDAAQLEPDAATTDTDNGAESTSAGQSSALDYAPAGVWLTPDPDWADPLRPATGPHSDADLTGALAPEVSHESEADVSAENYLAADQDVFNSAADSDAVTDHHGTPGAHQAEAAESVEVEPSFEDAASSAGDDTYLDSFDVPFDEPYDSPAAAFGALEDSVEDSVESSLESLEDSQDPSSPISDVDLLEGELPVHDTTEETTDAVDEDDNFEPVTKQRPAPFPGQPVLPFDADSEAADDTSAQETAVEYDTDARDDVVVPADELVAAEFDPEPQDASFVVDELAAAEFDPEPQVPASLADEDEVFVTAGQTWPSALLDLRTPASYSPSNHGPDGVSDAAAPFAGEVAIAASEPSTSSEAGPQGDDELVVEPIAEPAIEPIAEPAIEPDLYAAAGYDLVPAPVQLEPWETDLELGTDAARTDDTYAPPAGAPVAPEYSRPDEHHISEGDTFFAPLLGAREFGHGYGQASTSNPVAAQSYPELDAPQEETLTRQQRRALKAADENAQKAAKDAERAAQKAAKDAERAAQKAAKDADRAAQKQAKAAARPGVPAEADTAETLAGEPTGRRRLRKRTPDQATDSLAAATTVNDPQADDLLRPRFRVAPLSVRAAVIVVWLTMALFVAGAAAMLSLALSGSGVTVAGHALPASLVLVAVGLATVEAIILLLAGSGTARGELRWWRVAVVAMIPAVPLLPLAVLAWVLLLGKTTRDWVL